METRRGGGSRLGALVVLVALGSMAGCKQNGLGDVCGRQCLAGERCDATLAKCVPNEPPAIRISVPAADQLISTDTFHLVGLAADEDYSFEEPTVTFEGATVPLGVNNGGDFDQVLAAPLADGRAATITVNMHDALGAAGTASVQVRVDRVAPTCTVTQPTAGQRVSGATTQVTLDLTDGSNQFGPAAYSLDNGATWTEVTTATGVVKFTVPLPQDVERSQAILVRGADAAGNTCTGSVEVQLDTRGPTVTLTAPTATTLGRQAMGSVAVTFDVADASGIASAEVLAPPLSTWQPATVTGGTARYAWALPATDDGVMRTVQVRATDAAGNVTVKQATFVVDVIPPTCLLLAPANGASFTGTTLATTISWTVTDGSQQLGSAEVSTDDGATWLPVMLAGSSATYGWALSPTWDGVTRTVRARGTDAAGNRCLEQTATVGVDVVAPTLTLTAPANNAVVGTQLVSFTGTVSDGNTLAAPSVKLDFGDGAGLRNTAASPGGWGLALTTSTTEDFTPHAVTVRATDAAGNVGTLQARVVIDRVAPQLLVITPAEGQALGTGGLTNGNVTLQAQATDGDPGVVTERLVNGAWQVVTQGTALLATSPTDDGAVYAQQLRARDTAGNSASATRSYTVDRVAPSCTVTQPQSGQRLAGTSTTVAVSLADGSNHFGNVGYSLDNGGAWVDTNTTTGSASLTVPLPQLVERSQNLLVHGTDAAGNSCSASIPVQIDTLPPTVTLTAPTGATIGKQPSGTVDVTFTVADGVGVASAEVLAPPASTWQSAIVTQGTAHFTWTLPTGDDGVSRTLQVRATDLAGNVTVRQATFVVDVVAPTCALVSPVSGSTFTNPNATLTVGWTVVDGSTHLSSAEVSTDNGTTWSQVTPSGTSASYTWPLTATWDGVSRTTRVRGADAAGNTCVEQSATVTFDFVAPRLAVTSPTDNALTAGATVSFVGTVVDGNTSVTPTVRVDFADGVGPRSATVAAGGWNLSVPTSATDDHVTHTVTVRATDAAGNVATVSTHVLVDRVAPQLAITAPTEGQVFGLAQLTNNAVTVQAQATDGDPAVVTELLVGASWQALTLGSGTVGTSATDNGTVYTQVVRARDGAGNTTQASRSYKVDRVAPTLVGTVPTTGGVSGGRTFAAQFSEAVAVTGPSVPVTFVPAAPGTATWALDGSNTVLTVASLTGDQTYAAQLQDARIADLAGNPLVATTGVSFRTRPARPTNGQVMVAQTATQKVEWFRSAVDADGVIALVVRVINPTTSARTWLLGWADPKTGNWTLQDSQPATQTGASLVAYVEQVNGAPRRRASAWLGDGTTGVMYTYGTAGSVTGARLFATPLAPGQLPGAEYGTFVNTGWGWGLQRTNNPTYLTYLPTLALDLQGTSWGVMAGDGSGTMVESHLDCVTFAGACNATTASGQVSQILDCGSGTCLLPCDGSYYHYVRTPSAWALLQPSCSGTPPFVQMATDAQTTHYTAVTTFGSSGVANAGTTSNEAWLAWTQSPSNTVVSIGLLALQFGQQPSATKTLTVEPLQPLTSAGSPDYQYVIEPVVGPSTVGLLYVTGGSLMFRE